MTPDPLDALQNFYQECQMAPVPESLARPAQAPWWFKFIVPLGGLAVGCALAAALLSAPTSSSSQASFAIAQALAYRSLPEAKPKPQSSNPNFGQFLTYNASTLLPSPQLTPPTKNQKSKIKTPEPPCA